jgi:hypothetical protein
MLVIVEPITLNFAVSAVVMSGIAAMIAMVMAEAIMQYSMAVAPD